MTPSMLNGKIYANFKTTLYQLPPTTCKEVMNAVGKLNTSKSADENGIQAEHFRNAKEELAPLLCEIINQIFQDLDIPDSMCIDFAVQHRRSYSYWVLQAFRSGSSIHPLIHLLYIWCHLESVYWCL
jgi:hypothetical protein